MKCLITTLITVVAGTSLSILGMFLNWRCCSGGEDTALSQATGILALPGALAAKLVDTSGGWPTVAAFLGGTFMFWLIIGLLLGLVISLAWKRKPIH